MTEREVHAAPKPRAPSTRTLNRQLGPALYVLMIGMVIVLAVSYFYPPLDLNALTYPVVALFLVPLFALVVVNIRKRLPANVERLRRLYLGAGAILIALGVVLGINGTADTRPPRLVRTSITAKHHTVPARGGGRGSYILTLASWRPGRTAEEITVSSAQYRDLGVGDQVVVEVHAGLFRVPWYGRLSRR